MSWRIAVEHRSRYLCAGVVTSSYNEARITPLTTTSQLVIDAQVVVDPPTRAYRYLDYWGSVVHAFDLHVPHTELTVTGRSVVETGTAGPAVDGVGWDVLADPARRDAHAEVLAPTASVPLDRRLAAIGSDLRAGRTPAEAARAALGWVGETLSYVRGSTGVHTSAVEAWEGGAGVCQDFAHLALALIRPMGIPARYCSGYLHPDPSAAMGTTVAGESHAWIEWWAGDWQAVDPTSGSPVAERHVLVARGRDYADVAPLKGVLTGGPTAALEVSVELSRVG